MQPHHFIDTSITVVAQEDEWKIKQNFVVGLVKNKK